MPPSHRHTDICTGHGCYPSRANAEGSPDTFVNNLAQHRLGDAWESHCCGPPCHGANADGGSPDVFTNGLPSCRIGDPVSCGSNMSEGSEDVIIN